MLNRLINHLRWRRRMIQRIYWPQFWYALFLPGRVQSGPFSGMRYNRTATGSVVLPKLIGTYERELHPVLAALNMAAYDLCVDVGAGEGYYAVGLCYRHPHLHMIAFESTARGRKRLRALAHKNSVLERISLRGHCTPAALQVALQAGRRPLLIMDVEGAEEILLDPEVAPTLVATDFIVEVHPERNERLEQIISRRFEPTHRLERISQQARKTLPGAVCLPRFLQAKAAYLMDEFRGPQFWLHGTVLAVQAL
jgi:hypothetical protein